MGNEERLLERISRLGSGDCGSRFGGTAEDLDALMDSVRRHVAHILNSRQGMSEAQPEYGLPALTDIMVSVGDHRRRLADAIQRTVQRYEPRLRRVRVSCEEQESEHDKPVYRIEAILRGRNEEHQVSYDTTLVASGRFDVGG